MIMVVTFPIKWVIFNHPEYMGRKGPGSSKNPRPNRDRAPKK